MKRRRSGAIARLCVATALIPGATALAACGGDQERPAETTAALTTTDAENRESQAGPLAEVASRIEEAGIRVRNVRASDAVAALVAGDVDITMWESEPAASRYLRVLQNLAKGSPENVLFDRRELVVFFLGQERPLTAEERAEFSAVVKAATAP